MSSVYRCDRCGKYYDKKPIVSKATGYDGKDHFISNVICYQVGWVSDLCQECTDSLKDWWENKNG